jgi:hypothetical protein
MRPSLDPHSPQRPPRKTNGRALPCSACER